VNAKIAHFDSPILIDALDAKDEADLPGIARGGSRMGEMLGL
jgi:hypothetical protein